ncbi:MAG: serine acetyltransferase [Paludibacteraceae bacterium]|nr:serine acetyltransferase [Paludibacteraceae bacterium]
MPDIAAVVRRLVSPEFDGKLMYHCHADEPYPSGEALREFIDIARAVVFPGFYGSNIDNAEMLEYHLGVRMERLYQILCEQLYAGLCFGEAESICLQTQRDEAERIATAFIEYIPDLKLTLRTDVEAIYDGDPAAKNFGEVILSYPGLRAIFNYRVAHFLLNAGASIIVPRMITEMAHSDTGIDIHPGATIDKWFAIDHGTGVVIGETSVLGDHVKLYQGVTLGAKSFPLDEQGNPIKGIARHPILEDGVVVYAGATILGRITIGRNAVIGGNTWVTEDVPADDVVFNS